MQETPANLCEGVRLHLNNGTVERLQTPTQHRMEAEFRTFLRQIREGDYSACQKALEQSLLVSRILTQARQSAGIRFPADN